MEKARIVISKINKILKPGVSLVVGIDGRCASGKTTLANEISGQLNCNIIHMDDFFLQSHQRTAERLREPGGNIDYERFLEEVVEPLKNGLGFSYRPYSCRTFQLGNPINIEPGMLTVVEGAYSCHPKFSHIYDLRFFMDVEPGEQIERIRIRNGEAMLEKFKTIWIPMEEKYFSEFKIKETCECI